MRCRLLDPGSRTLLDILLALRLDPAALLLMPIDPEVGVETLLHRAQVALEQASVVDHRGPSRSSPGSAPTRLCPGRTSLDAHISAAAAAGRSPPDGSHSPRGRGRERVCLWERMRMGRVGRVGSFGLVLEAGWR